MKIFTLTPNPGLDRTLYVENIEFDQVLRSKSVRLDWGGKGFNVSRALQSLGIKSTALGFCGGGTGKMLEAGLNQAGVMTDFTFITDETRTNTVIHEIGTKRYIKVNEAGPTIQTNEISALFKKIASLTQPDSIWILAGRLPLGLPESFYAQVIQLVKSKSGLVLLDTSGEAFRLGCKEKPYLIKPNKEEAEEMIGKRIIRQSDKISAARYFMDMGIKFLALSLGAEGLILANENEIIHAVPPQVKAHIDMGAGDSLMAGIVYGLTQNYSLAEMGKMGVAVGTASVMHEGVAEFNDEDVQNLLGRIQVELLN